MCSLHETSAGRETETTGTADAYRVSTVPDPTCDDVSEPGTL